LRLEKERDIIGYDMAAMKLISRVAIEKQQSMSAIDQAPVDVWAGMGLGSDVAAALQSRGRRARN